MRKLRELRQNVWYEIRTHVNNNEPLFYRQDAWALFARVFRETKKRFVFKVRAARLEGDLLFFYIKPKDGFQLPAIMKRLKQAFAQQFNRHDGRTGHIWGDRYWSRIIEGEPPEDEAEEARGETGARPRSVKIAEFLCILPPVPRPAPTG